MHCNCSAMHCSRQSSPDRSNAVAQSAPATRVDECRRKSLSALCQNCVTLWRRVLSRRMLAAPFVGNGGWPSDDIEPLSDLGAKLPEHTPIYLYHGSNDQTAPFGHVEFYAKSIPQAVVRRLAGRDHQLNNNMSDVAADIRRVRSAARSPVRPA